MLTSPLKADGVCLFPSTSLFVRISALSVEVMTTEGALRIECDHPRFFLRDLLAGRVTEATAGTNFGRSPLAYTIRSTTLSKRRTTVLAGPPVVPENVPLPKGVVLFEAAAFADYHVYDSLQVVGVTRQRRVLIGLSSTSYELTFALQLDPHKAYNDFVAADLIGDQRAHFTTHSHGDFLNWLPVKRISCVEIVETYHRPESWSGMDLLADFRTEPNHAAHRAKVKPPATSPGIDI